MFGRQDNHNTDNPTTSNATGQLSAEPTNTSSPYSKGGYDSTNNSQPTANSSFMGAPVVEPTTAPLTDTSALPSSNSSSNSTLDDLTPKDDSSIVSKFSPPDADSSDDKSDDLLSLKQQALQQLTPLVGHLDQTPEEKFRTTMMMIQAADNQSLIKDAYSAAQQISDEKLKAQALLDIVNEINYFTHQHKTEES